MKHISILFFLVFIGPVWAQSAGELLADAIKISNSLNVNTSVEQRLEKYEQIQVLVRKLTSNYPGSDPSIKLLSGQSVGAFNFSRIQSDYVSELVGYYEKICVVAPNFECLGFVSWREGRKYCRTDNFRQLELAHEDILNAITIFESQGSKRAYVDSALSSYRDCAGISLISRNEVLTDKYATKLIPILLSLGRTDEARAIVQQVQSPFFKFESALLFQIQTNSEGLTQKSIDRFESYMGDNLASDPWLYWLASLSLHKEAVFALGSPESRKPARNPSYSWDRPSSPICEAGWLQDYYEVGVEVVDSVVEKLGNSSGRREIDLAITNSQAHHVVDDLSRCQTSEAYGNALSTFTYLRLIDNTLAKEFLSLAASSGYDREQMQEFAFQVYKKNPARFLARTDFVRSPLFDEFYGFKLALFGGDVCGAVKTMFEEFKGTDLYPKAVAYILRSGEVSSNQKYDCGDAGLEMLLN